MLTLDGSNLRQRDDSPRGLFRAPDGGAGGGEFQGSPRNYFEPASLAAAQATLRSLKATGGNQTGEPFLATIKLSARLPYEITAELTRLQGALAEAERNCGLLAIFKRDAGLFTTLAAALTCINLLPISSIRSTLLLVTACETVSFWHTNNREGHRQHAKSRDNWRAAKRSFEEKTLGSLGDQFQSFLSVNDPTTYDALTGKVCDLSLDSLDADTGVAKVTLKISESNDRN